MKKTVRSIASQAPAKYVMAAASAAILCAFLCSLDHQLYAQSSSAPADVKINMPVGKARGIFPGRVVWVHNPKVASWDGATGFWWSDSNTSQSEANRMMQASICTLAGEKSARAAWTKLFTYFNAKKNRGTRGYRLGEKIAVKINTNNTDSHASSNEINASPQSVYALLKTLVEDARVPQKNITIFDASRFIPDNIFLKCRAAFPDVVYMDHTGGDGRTKAEFKDNAIPYSVDNGPLARGLALCAVDADYLINLAVLKGHVGQGVTLCAKNYYGVTSIDPDWRKNAHNNFDQDRTGKPKYMTFVDFLGHKDLGEKTMLFLVDGLYGARAVNGLPSRKWHMAPFNDHWAASLFASQDGVAIDAVGLDFLRSEWPDAPDMPYSDQYLIEAAQADNPPSGTVYDPERDGSRLPSLGVMEHWNNMNEKKYSRNLGKKEGIELVTVSQNAGK